MARPRRRKAPARAAAGEPREPRRGDWFRRLPAAVQVLTPFVGLVGALLGVFFVLWPNLKPQPTPEEGSATMTVRLGRPLTYGQYLVLVRASQDTPSSGADRRGPVIHVDAAIVGYRGGELVLRWILFDDETQEPVAEDEALRFVPDRQREALTHPVWIDVPRSGRFYVRVELYPPGAEDRPSVPAIDAEETEPFAWPPA